MVSARAWTFIAIALVLEAGVGWAYLEGVKIYEPAQTASQVTEGEKMLLVGTAVAAVFPLVLALCGFLRGLDGFALGSILIAAMVETALYMGWARSLQAEGATAFWVSTCFPALLIGFTFFFHRLQKEKLA